MVWISRRIERRFALDDLTLDALLRTPLERLGLEPHPGGAWVYRSRPYQLLGRTIQPVLRFGVERSSAYMTLSCQRVEVQGLGSLAEWVQVKGGVKITPAPMGTMALHWLELGVQARGGLQMMPRSLLERGMLRVLELSSERLGHALRRRLTVGCSM